MIKASDISVIVQGAIDEKVLDQTIPVVREVFKDSELILVTEEDSKSNHFSRFDTVILHSPVNSNTVTKGLYTFETNGYGYKWDGVISNTNLNRQITKTRIGIEKASNPYVLKIRSDMMVMNLDWLSFFDEAVRLTKPTHLTKPILCGNYRNVLKWEIFPYHYHDWFNFGLKEDVLKLFSCPLAPDNFEIDEKIFTKNPFGNWIYDLKAAPETYIGGKLFSTDDVIAYDPKEVLYQMINHFVPIDLGLHYAWSLKFPQEMLFENCIISYSDWLTYIKGDYND